MNHTVFGQGKPTFCMPILATCLQAIVFQNLWLLASADLRQDLMVAMHAGLASVGVEGGLRFDVLRTNADDTSQDNMLLIHFTYCIVLMYSNWLSKVYV